MFYLKTIAAVLAALVVWVTLVVWGVVAGWWDSPLAPPGDLAAFRTAAVARLEADNPGNAALVLIEDGRVVAEHFGGVDPVTGDTLFATASLSKWLTAYGVMTLVQQGRVDLDRPVEDYLTRWALPESEFDHGQVTVRRLLSHTAGLTDGLGWGDYEPDETVPGLVDSLEAPRSSSGDPARIAVGREPGSAWQYSGGGYLILELLVEEVTGQPFADYMSRAVFGPIGMRRTTYRYLGALDGTAGSYDRQGRPATVYRYASRAATGLNSSAADLTRFVLAQIPGALSGPLEPETLEVMRTPHGSTMAADIWGLGTILYAPTDGGDHVFGHDGGNEPAINATARINPETGDAIVALTTGSYLASELGAEWVLWQTGRPDFFSVVGGIERVMPWLLGGALLILAGAVVIAWRRRPRRHVQA